MQKGKGNKVSSDRLCFLGLQKSLQMVTASPKFKNACPLEENYDKPRQHIKKQRDHFTDQGPI